MNNSCTSIANAFNEYFATLVTKMAAEIPVSSTSYNSYLKEMNSHTIFLVPTNEVEIQAIIASLKNTKATGSLDLPVDIIKRIAKYVSLPLTHLVNQSFLTGIVPHNMKTAIISPIFKTGDCLELKNYRPISKLNCFSKILEKAMYKRIYDFSLC